MTPELERQRQEALFKVFEAVAFEDQRNYYHYKIKRNRQSGRQVNVLRALFSLITGASSALAAYIIAVYPNVDCSTATGEAFLWRCSILPVLPIISVVAPAIAAAFTTLADLFQWDRSLSLYKSALENLEVADALSPLTEMDDERYRVGLTAFAEGTLGVMRDETGQWGSLIRTPAQNEAFLQRAKDRIQNTPPEAGESPLDGEPPSGNT